MQRLVGLHVASHADHFHVLDRVSVQGVPEALGVVGVISQVRRYPDGTHRYSMNIDDEGMILDEHNLSPTGEREPVETYFPPGRLFPWYDDDGVTKYFILTPGVDGSEMREEKEVVRIGRSGRRRAGRAGSTKVSETGEVRGVEHYEILEDLIDLIADANPLG